MNDRDICPYARGFIPQELTCGLREDRDRRNVSWWRRLGRTFTGYYDCPCEGFLPCGIYDEETRK